MSSKSVQFGFLPVEKNFVFSGGVLKLLDNFKEVQAGIESIVNPDGYIYPPIERTMRAGPKIRGTFLPENEWDWEEVPQSKRPALMHGLPPSHELQLDQTPLDNLRKTDGAFLMYLTGYLFGYRLQFADWWFDGRINMKSSHHVIIPDSKVSDFISKSYATWKTWPQQIQKRFTNILYMNSRSPMYEWDWERFAINYMVFDACYRHAESIASVRSPSHADRFQTLFSKYDLYFNADKAQEIVDLRNNLFHEALWDNGQPCNAGGQTSFDLTEFLWAINQRLIPALLGHSTEYIKARWDYLGTFAF